MEQIALQQFIVLTQALGLEGFNAQPLLKRFSLDASNEFNERPWRPLGELEELMLACMDISSDEGFGLVVATSYAQFGHGVLAKLALHAPTLRRTLDDLVRFHPICQNGRELNYSVRDGICTITFEPLSKDPNARRFRSEQIMAGIVALMRFCGLEESDLFGVTLQHPRPSYAHRYADAFGTNFSFDQKYYSISFNVHLLDAPRVVSDAKSYAIVHAEAVNALTAAVGRTSIVEKVTRLIRGTGTQWLSMKEVALNLHLSERTLRRQLSEVDTSFQQILESLRLNEAKQMIELGTFPLKQIAEETGYESMSNFNRAFKRCTGLTPTQWRSNNKAD